MGEVLVEVEGPALYAKQHAAIYDPARHVIIEASTKSGKTFGCLVWQFGQVCEREGMHCWCAPVYRQAAIAYLRAKKQVPKEIIARANDSDQLLELRNGSIWWFRSGEKPDNLYGDDYESVVIDEASRCRPEVWEALRTTLTATQGPSRIIGNVKGRKNWFYRIARKAEAGAVGHGYHKLTAYDAVEGKVLQAEEIEAARADLPEAVFRELYLAEPTQEGANPFTIGAIDKMVQAAWVERRQDVVCWGIDLAKSVDWTVAVGLDAAGDVCDLVRFQRSWLDTIGHLRALTSDVDTLVDATGVGDPIVEALQAGGRSNVLGFKFTATSKQQLMEGLAMDLQHGNSRFPEGVLAMELREFEYEHTRTGVRYSAPAGMHDDCVCAYALARMLFRRRLEDAWWM